MDKRPVTLFQWIVLLEKKIEEIITRYNATRGIPSGGAAGQYLRKTSATDYDVEWSTAGGGSGDVTAAGDNTFTGSNTFRRPVKVATPVFDGDAATKLYVDNVRKTLDNDVQELGNGLNDLDSEAVKKTGDQTIAGVKTFSFSPQVPEPTKNTDAATKKYVDDHSVGGGDVTAAGDNTFTGNNAFEGEVTFTGVVSVPEPTLEDEPATKRYVDEHSGGGGDVTAAGDNTFTGSNIFQKPVKVSTPVEDGDAATKKYVDDHSGGGGGGVEWIQATIEPPTVDVEFIGLSAYVEKTDPYHVKIIGKVHVNAADSFAIIFAPPSGLSSQPVEKSEMGYYVYYYTGYSEASKPTSKICKIGYDFAVVPNKYRTAVSTTGQRNSDYMFALDTYIVPVPAPSSNVNSIETEKSVLNIDGANYLVDKITNPQNPTEPMNI